MINQFKALILEHFPGYDLSMNECDDTHFLDGEVNAMWMMYQICNEWHPIETAPKDETQLLLNDKFDGVFVGRWSISGKCWFASSTNIRCYGDGYLDTDVVEHCLIGWRPLPIPPLTTEGGV